MTSTTSKPTETAVHPRRRSSRFTWLTAIAVVLAVALGFGAGFLTSQMVEDEPTGLADEATVSLIEDYMAAANAGDLESLAATTTPDFVLTLMNHSGVLAEMEGVEDMMTELGTANGLEATSEFMLQDDLVTSTYDELTTHGVQTFEITEGKISHAWITLD